ncbi:MAG: hypothetical protein WD081_04150 [Gammaproteobacteria bacterium]
MARKSIEWNKAGSFIVVLFGLVSALVTILSAPESVRPIALTVIIFAVILGLLVIFWKLFGKLGPSAIVDDPYVIKVSYEARPASSLDIHWIASLQKKFYDASDAVPIDILQEWHSACPEGFFVIVNQDDVRVGHIDILPIRPQVYEKLRVGQISEKQIRGDSLFSANERSVVTRIYVESIIIDPAEGAYRPFALRMILREFERLIERVADSNNVTFVSAMAATADGQRLLEGLAFTQVSDSGSRVDGNVFYEIAYADLRRRLRRATDSGASIEPVI